MNTKKFMAIPDNATELYLQTEVTKIAENEKEEYLRIADDEDKTLKVLILNGIKTGAMFKKGVNSYSEPGNTVTYSLEEMVDRLKKAKEMSDDLYLKLEASVNTYLKPIKKSK